MCPFKELIHQGREHGLSLQQASSGRQLAPGLVELVEFAHTQESLAPDGEARDGGFPETPPCVRPPSDLDGRRAAIIDGVPAEQRVVDGVRVGLDVSGEASEHLAHGGAGVLGLKLEEDVLSVGQNDEEVGFSARLPPAIWKWLRADRDSGGVGGQAEAVFASVVGAGEHDGAEASANFFDRARHGAAIELDAVGVEWGGLSRRARAVPTAI